MNEPRRRYPQSWLAAQVLGTVGTDNYGLSGIEESRWKKLHGADGQQKIVRDALGKPISLVEQKRDVPGEDLRLDVWNHPGARRDRAGRRRPDVPAQGRSRSCSTRATARSSRWRTGRV